MGHLKTTILCGSPHAEPPFLGLLPRDRSGDRICVISPDGSSLTYDEVLAKTASYAAALVAAGVKPGDRVAAQVDKSKEALFLYLGCVRAGAVFLPLNTAYTPAELDYFIGDAEPALVVAAPGQAEMMTALAVEDRRAGRDAGSCRRRHAAGAGGSRRRIGVAGRRARAGRSRRRALHVGHDRTAEGCDAQPREFALQCRRRWSRRGGSRLKTC